MASPTRLAVAMLATFALLAPSSLLAPPPAEARGTALRPAGRLQAAVVLPARPPQRVAVAEPKRARPSGKSPRFSLGTVAHAVDRGPGVRLAGWPMLRPQEIDRVIASARRASAIHGASVRPPSPTVTNRIPPNIRRTQSLPSNPSASGTGINRWWRYHEQDLSGGGHLLVNVGTGNLLLQSDDMSVPHKGVSLAFRRTYNSQSPATVTGDLQTYTSLYGNGWTSTFDAHVIRTSPGHFSVYDIDGTRYDFTPSGTPGVVVGPPGQPTLLAWDGACGLIWTKKSGTTYYFYNVDPNQTGCAQIGTMGGYAGKLYQIIGRNRNTYLTFLYSWDNGNASVTGKIARISVQAESGLAATLAFADVNGRRLLQQLTYPDGSTNVQYGYDANGNLVTVSRPPNNAAGIRPTEWYGYQAIGTDQIMSYAASPRIYAACGTPAGCYGDGAAYTFGFAGTSAAASTLSSISDWGNVNPVIADGTNAGPIQGAQYPSNVYNYNTQYYTTGVTTPTYRDTSGHMTNWVVDGLDRPTQTQQCDATANQGQLCTGTWLVTNTAWDASNDLVSITDPRGYETDFAYDAGGNVIAIGKPRTSTSQGTFKPTQLYDYDTNGNITAYCDEAQTHAANADWTATPAPSDSLCSATGSGGHIRLTYAYPAYEPAGEMTSIIQASGYTERFAYDTGPQGGVDYGQATSVTGDSFTQIDGTQAAEQQSAVYDANGNISSYGKGYGSTAFQRDALGRMTVVTDPDGISAYRNYYPDGSVQSTQSAAQRAAGVSDAYTYDIDGNKTTETTNFGNRSAVRQWWYDGIGRLIEASIPTDRSLQPGGSPLDYFTYPYLTRHLFDLTGDGRPVAFGATHVAHGGEFDVQEYVPASGAAAWSDIKATDYDAIDRVTATSQPSVCADPVGMNSGAAPCSRTTVVATSQYDAGSTTYGLLASATDGLNRVVTNSYDELGRVVGVSYSGSLVRSIAYGANGKVSQETLAGGGGASYAYDTDERLTTVTELAMPGFTSPATVTTAYYPNGWKMSAGVTSSALTNAALVSYAYRNDGRTQRRRLAYPGQYDFTTAYTNAGRPTTSSTPFFAQDNVLSYDAYGRVSQRVTPEGTYGSISYDQEDAISAFTFGGTAFSLIRDLSGALVGGTGFNGGFGFSETAANGVLLKGDGTTSAWDTLNHVVLATGTTTTAFDNALQQTSDHSTAGLVGSYTDPNGTMCTRGTTTSDHFGYDAEKRTSSSSRTTTTSKYTLDEDLNCYQTTTSSTSTHGYTWNAHGNLALLSHTAGIFAPSESVHRGPDDILFTTNGGGTLNRVWLDDVGFYDVASATMNVYQRDLGGRLLVTESNWTGSPPAFISSPYDPDPPTPAIDNTNTNQVWSLVRSKSDAVTDHFVVFGGVRATNVGTNQWTTPDMFAGSPANPLSQQSFVWNNNDPYSYSDPSGYRPQRLATCDCGGSHAYESIDAAKERQRRQDENQVNYVGYFQADDARDGLNKENAGDGLGGGGGEAAEAAHEVLQEIHDQEQVIKPVMVSDSHHMVAARSRKAAAARALLQLAKLSVEQFRVDLPRWFHASLHTDKYYEYVNNLVRENAGSSEDIIRAMQGLREKLEEGWRPH